MKLKLKLLPAIAAAALTLGAMGASAKTKVGVLSFNDKEPRYTTTKERALDVLKQNGFDADKVQVIVEDGMGKKEGVEAALKKLQAQNVDIYVALGTSAAVPVAKAITDKPVVIGMVYDPVSAHVIKSWNNSDNNVTGSSNFVDIATFMRRLIKRSEGTYTIKKIQVPYAPSEKNAELQMMAVKSIEKELGVEVTPVPLNNEAELTQWLKQLKGHADLVFLTGCNIVGTHIAKIVDATIKAKVPTATHLDDLVDRGSLYGLVAAPEDVGRLAGESLVKVLNGATPSSVPVQYPEPRLMINKKTQQAGGFTIPPAMQQWAAAAGG